MVSLACAEVRQHDEKREGAERSERYWRAVARSFCSCRPMWDAATGQGQVTTTAVR